MPVLWKHTQKFSIHSFIWNAALDLKGYFSNKARWKNITIFKMTATVFQSGNLQGNISLKRKMKWFDMQMEILPSVAEQHSAAI